MVTQYLVSVPHKNIRNAWIIIKTFDTRDRAVAFANKTWSADNGYVCLISHDEKYFTLRIPNPNYALDNKQFVCVKKFNNRTDALSFAIENYEANNDGSVSLISRVEF